MIIRTMALAWLACAACAFAQDAAVGISYDIATREVVVVRADGATQPPVGQSGDGKDVKNAQISPEELDNLANAEAGVSPEEEALGRHDERGDFIPYTVIGTDDREVVLDTTGFPARAVVHINFRDPSNRAKNCTGAMIAPRFVLTAAHCVRAPGERGGWHRNFIVRAGRNASTAPFGACGARRLLVLGGWLTNDLSYRLADLGVIELDCDVGEQTGWLPMAVSDAAVGTPINAQGYPCRNRQQDQVPIVEGRQYVSKDVIRVAWPEKLFYQNDSAGCMSGSPIMLQSDARIVAVHTHGLHGEPPWSQNNAGTRLTAERINLVATWMATAP